MHVHEYVIVLVLLVFFADLLSTKFVKDLGGKERLVWKRMK